MENVINAAAKDQGVSVSVTSDSSGVITIKSNSKDTTSEVSYLGNHAAAADIGKGLMTQLIDGSSSVGAAKISQVKDSLVYDGRSIAASTASDSFEMVINGVAVNVQLGSAVTGGTTTVKAVATALQSALQSNTGAVKQYNDALGLTAGTLDTKSGLTGLNLTDFTADVGENGNLVIKYNGDEKVNFSFRDVGDRSVASDLGLANGSSKSGGNQGLTLQIGDTGDSFNQLNVSIANMHANSMGISGVDISTQTGAANAMDTIKSAINYVSDCRGTLGATQNRLEHTISNLSVMQENIQDAESTIRDTDVADEMMKYTKNSILVQSAQAMLAQANQQPQGVLQLLQ